MGSFSIGHWIIVLAVILILFGAGKIPSVMGDVAKGIKNFKSGMKDDEPETPRLDRDDASVAASAAESRTAQRG